MVENQAWRGPYQVLQPNADTKFKTNVNADKACRLEKPAASVPHENLVNTLNMSLSLQLFDSP